MRIAVHYTHYQCLGHTTRVLSLLAAIRQILPQAELVGIQGSQTQDYLSLAAFHSVCQLSFPLFSRKDFYKGQMMSDVALESRATECLALIKQKTPEFFITEYFPMGRAQCRQELLPTLIYLNKRRRKVISSAGYPIVSEASRGFFDFFIKFYNRIFIHCPAEEISYIASTYSSVKERSLYLDLFRRNAGQISFTGYMEPQRLPFLAPYNESVKLPEGFVNVLVTRGSGVSYSEIISAALSASELLGKDFFFTLVAGPETTDQEWLAFQRMMATKRIKNARLVRSTSCFTELIAESDVCINPAPYNTSVLLLKHRKKSVLIPWEGSERMPLREQVARARMLHDVLGSIIVPFAKLTPGALAGAVKRALQCSPSQDAVPKEWLNGKRNFQRQFKEMVLA